MMQRLSAVARGTLPVWVYATGSWVLFSRLGLADAHHLPGCACGDQASQVWFLAYWKYWALHGSLPLATRQLNYPVGFGVLDNASMPLLGLLALPTTILWGPVASYAVLARLAIVVSATTGYVVLRRLSIGRVAAVAGGAFYGFSPYMTHHASSHVFLTFVPLPALVMLLVYRAASEDAPPHPFRSGVLLGSLCVAQFFIDSEILVSMVLLAGLVASGFVVARPRRLGARAASLRRLAVGAAAVMLPALSYPAWAALAGPGHVSGPTQSVAVPGIDAASTLFPSDRGIFAGAAHTVHVPPPPFLGDTGFVGPLLLAVALLGAVSGWRRRWVPAVTALGITAWVLSLGPRLVVDGHASSIPLPFSLFTHLPVLQDLIASRLTLWTDLAVAALLAVALDQLVMSATGGSARRRGRVEAVFVASLTAIGCLAAMPASPAAVTGIGVAALFRDDAVDDRIAYRCPALSYPVAQFPDDAPMIWQAESELSFSLVGGYVIHPGAGGFESRRPSPLQPSDVQFLLTHAATMSHAIDARPSVHDFGQDLHEFVHRYRLTTLLVSSTARGWERVATVFQAEYGRPWHYGPLLVWHVAARSSCRQRLAGIAGPVYGNTPGRVATLDPPPLRR